MSDEEVSDDNQHVAAVYYDVIISEHAHATDQQCFILLPVKY